MNEPPVPPLSGRALEVLVAEKSPPPAPHGVKDSVRGRLATSLYGSHGAAVGATRPLSRLGSLALAFAAGAVVGAAVYAKVMPKPASVPVETPAKPATGATTSTPALLPPVDEIALVPADPAPLPSRGAVPESDLSAERALLDRARAALGRGENEDCLTITRAHGERFASGRLAEEREALAIKALVNLGRVGEARQRGARFRARYPRSLLLPAVQSALDSIP